MKKKEAETYYPKSRSEWRKWLAKYHEDKQSIWLIFYRTSSSKKSLTWSDAVDEALCFGWIDSTKKSIDKESYMQYFSKRKANSTWSKINKEKVEQLIEEQQMTDAGLECINIAKENGAWTFLDDIDQLIIPDDLLAALNKENDAMDFYQSLSNSIKKQFLYWVKSAKTEATRSKRIEAIASDAAKGLRPKPFR